MSKVLKTVYKGRRIDQQYEIISGRHPVALRKFKEVVRHVREIADQGCVEITEDDAFALRYHYLDDEPKTEFAVRLIPS